MLSWADATICYLDILDKLQKHICRTVGFWLAASLKHLTHCQDAASLNLFHRYYLDFHPNWLNWFYFLVLKKGPLVTLNSLHDFLSLFLDVIRMPMSSFFPRTATLRENFDSRIWPKIYTALSMELIDTFLIFGLPLNSFLKWFSSFFSSFTCDSMSSSVCSPWHGLNPNQKITIKGV